MDAEILKKMAKGRKTRGAPPQRGLRTSLQRLGEGVFSGFVVDPEDLGRRFTVELLLDGYPIRTARAEAYVHELAEQQIGDGCYGFLISLPEQTMRDGGLVEARLANLGLSVGGPIALDRPAAAGPDPAGPGSVQWLGGIRFSGTVLIDGPEAPALDVFVDGQLTMRAAASGWTRIGGGTQDARPGRGFDFHLPDRFADARVHRLEVVNAKGEQLAGSPLRFMAVADGIERALARLGGEAGAEKLRGAWFDRLMPMSLPLAQYQNWRERFPLTPPPATALRAAVVMIGARGMEETLESLEAQSHADWVAASLPQTGEFGGFEPKLARAFLNDDGGGSDFVLFGLAGTLFAATALARIALAFAKFAMAKAVYGDVDVLGADGAPWPLAFPAFDAERMLEQGFCAHLFALPRAAAERALAHGAADLYRLFNSVLDDAAASPQDIVHVPGALGALPAIDTAAASKTLAAATRAHLQRRGVKAEVTERAGGVFPAVRVARAPAPGGTTIVIPTRNRAGLLKDCIESIRPAVARADVDILVVDNDSREAEALDYLAAIDGAIARVLKVPGEFNFARLNNLAAQAVTSEFLCLLNNDTKALDALWLEEMLGRIAPADVGAVGALLLWPSGGVQHGGVVLGPSFMAGHAFDGRGRGDPGYGDLLRVAHECSAVTAACLLTRRADYAAVGGMDETRFPVNFNDVDYCLKLRARGQRIVFTPHARLLHLESASRGLDTTADRRPRYERELQNLRSKWGPVLAADPYYSPLLSLDPIPFSGLAWPPRGEEPRINTPPVPGDVPPGF
ncbi:MAG: glycosyltransferase family 2 protein [Xanthobacteraceae bacterium]